MGHIVLRTLLKRLINIRHMTFLLLLFFILGLVQYFESFHNTYQTWSPTAMAQKRDDILAKEIKSATEHKINLSQVIATFINNPSEELLSLSYSLENSSRAAFSNPSPELYLEFLIADAQFAQALSEKDMGTDYFPYVYHGSPSEITQDLSLYNRLKELGLSYNSQNVFKTLSESLSSFYFLLSPLFILFALFLSYALLWKSNNSLLDNDTLPIKSLSLVLQTSFFHALVAFVLCFVVSLAQIIPSFLVNGLGSFAYPVLIRLGFISFYTNVIIALVLQSLYLFVFLLMISSFIYMLIRLIKNSALIFSVLITFFLVVNLAARMSQFSDDLFWELTSLFFIRPSFLLDHVINPGVLHSLSPLVFVVTALMLFILFSCIAAYAKFNIAERGGRRF